MDALAEVPHDLLHGRGAGQALAGIGGDRVVERHTRAGADEMVRRFAAPATRKPASSCRSQDKSGETSSIGGSASTRTRALMPTLSAAWRARGRRSRRTELPKKSRPSLRSTGIGSKTIEEAMTRCLPIGGRPAPRAPGGGRRRPAAHSRIRAAGGCRSACALHEIGCVDEVGEPGERRGQSCRAAPARGRCGSMICSSVWRRSASRMTGCIGLGFTPPASVASWPRSSASWKRTERGLSWSSTSSSIAARRPELTCSGGGGS